MENMIEQLIEGRARATVKGSVISRDEQGNFHKENGPAIENPNGDKAWYHHGNITKAIVDGSEYWFKNGKFHRESEAAIKYKDGTEDWMIDGKMHRIGGPAQILANGRLAWCENNVMHREDGPALTFPEGGEYYYYQGTAYPEVKNNDQ